MAAGAFLMAVLLSFPSMAAAAEATTAAPELIALELALTDKQKEKKSGAVTEQAYEAYLLDFRAELKAAVAAAPPTPANSATHARIRVLLGERAGAIRDLNEALESTPGDADLIMSIGKIHYDMGDHAASLA